MESSVFTKIINRELPSTIVFENERLIVIENIAPEAPIHLLAIPKVAYRDIYELTQETDGQLLSELFKELIAAGTSKGAEDYRIITNKGAEAGQSIFHLHFHLLSGIKLS